MTLSWDADVPTKAIVHHRGVRPIAFLFRLVRQNEYAIMWGHQDL